MRSVVRRLAAYVTRGRVHQRATRHSWMKSCTEKRWIIRGFYSNFMKSPREMHRNSIKTDSLFSKLRKLYPKILNRSSFSFVKTTSTGLFCPTRDHRTDTITSFESNHVFDRSEYESSEKWVGFTKSAFFNFRFFTLATDSMQPRRQMTWRKIPESGPKAKEESRKTIENAIDFSPQI